MIWSLIKASVFIGLAIALSFGLAYVMETPGEVRIAFGTQEFSLEPIGFIAAILLLLLGFFILLKLAGLLVAILRFIVGDETALSRFWGKNREKRGYDALAEGMVALAAGEGATAIAQANKAEKLLKRPELTRLLSAQACEMSGDRKGALSHYKALLQNDRTRFVGVRGILQQKLAEGDTETALKLAEKAFVLRPRHHGNLDTLFALQSETADWSGARATLTAKLRAKALPKDVFNRREALLSLADAQNALIEGDKDLARESALKANKLAPTLVPAAVLAAQILSQEGAKRPATRILKTAWKAMPHPDLTMAFGALEPDETPEARRKRFEQLVRLQPEHPETKMMLAELALIETDFPAARRAIGDLAKVQPTTRTLALMAAIEQGSGADETTVRAFLAKAMNASRGEQWVCSGCGHAHGNWAPACEHCKAFDTLEWSLPPKPKTDDAPMAAFLPLILGTNPETESETLEILDPESEHPSDT
ncbi:MAG: heme biosynthesis HemY N-terminal domain-containing protein [Paracoccaceae bacterium]